MPTIRRWAHRFAVLCVLLLAIFAVRSAGAQNIPGIDPNIEATLVADGPAIAGEELTVSIHFRPVSEEWHGYWKNPGDAGYGMQLDWDLPAGWAAGEPRYPVPQRLLIGNLMNHVYEGSYAVLVPLKVPENTPDSGASRIGLEAQWLACTDEICVPEQGELSLAVAMGEGDFGDSRFAGWRAEIPPLIDRAASFEIAGDTLRIAIPLPASLALADPHIFIANTDLIQYAATQTFTREDDLLVAEIPLSDPDAKPDELEAILSFGAGEGVTFMAEPGAVPSDGPFAQPPSDDSPAFGWLLLAALAGGLVLNIMPCVFPILSLKALSLVRAGGSEAEARSEGIAYSAGVILACAALGAIMLALRAAGEQVGWAFQLQEPGVVVALFVLACLIAANLAGLFALPAISITRSGEPASAFATGLLAAVAATPCTGPFMAAALGAALLLPTGQALLLFAVLGLGLALPFLLIGFVPAIRKLLPTPGAWMETFRKLLAIPMGLTAIALAWLLWRLGGVQLAWAAFILFCGIFILIVSMAKRRAKADYAILEIGFGVLAIAFSLWMLGSLDSDKPVSQAESILEPRSYSVQALSDARATGKPVFLWFTADWCLTCKANERVAIEREATRTAFDEAGVIALRGDWTRRDPAITEYLTEQDAAGVPLYVWYEPAGKAQILPQVLAPDSLVTLAANSSASSSGIDRSVAPDADLD